MDFLCCVPYHAISASILCTELCLEKFPERYNTHRSRTFHISRGACIWCPGDTPDIAILEKEMQVNHKWHICFGRYHIVHYGTGKVCLVDEIIRISCRTVFFLGRYA